jgi:UDP-N-acetylmuramoyl-L-alanyl-D-glutamate--2,6-diaminopimelate ligase
MLSLERLLAGTGIVGTGGGMDLGSMLLQPRQLQSGNFFFKLRSPQFRRSAAEAVGRGAKGVVLEAGDPEEANVPSGVPYVIVDDVNRAFARVCSRLFGDAHEGLVLIGITGTKGKTTVCHLVDGALRACGLRVGLLSSLVRRLPDLECAAPNTTPDALSLHSFLADLRRRGGTHAVIEVSSIGIAEERIFGLRFDALALTNLGSDHLEYHGGREAYIAVKRRLFIEPAFHRSASTLCAFNADDPICREIAKSSLGRVMTFGFAAADVTPEDYQSSIDGITLRLNGHELKSPLFGRHNASNLLAAATIVRDVMQSESAFRQLQNVTALPGRMERLTTTAGVDVYVDYAHTPESVRAALDAVREIAAGRRIVSLVGCSGNSDRAKRPLMARAAMEGSDLCIFTSDNPGDEHPASIVMDMLRGTAGAAEGRVKTVLDRSLAIAHAIREALPDGIVVLMGKGVEKFQRIAGASIPHSDHEAAARVLREVSQQVQ